MSGRRGIELQGRSLLVLKRMRGATLRVRSGTVWVTVAGCPGDRFLTPGQSLKIGSDGRLVAEALRGEARVTVEMPERRPVLCGLREAVGALARTLAAADAGKRMMRLAGFARPNLLAVRARPPRRACPSA